MVEGEFRRVNQHPQNVLGGLRRRWTLLQVSGKACEFGVIGLSRQDGENQNANSFPMIKQWGVDGGQQAAIVGLRQTCRRLAIQQG